MNTNKITPRPTIPSEKITIKIPRLPIRLGQFLKHAGIVQNGLEAKVKIQNGEISVNGQLELRRGRQLCEGDQISMDVLLYVIESMK